MKNLISKGLLIVSIMFFGLTSCEKEEGPQGPAGKDGEDGNANVQTEIVKVFSYEWDYDNPFYIVSKTSNLLTQDIIDNGSVHFYYEIGDGAWLALPYGTMGFAVMVNNLEIVSQ